MNRRIFLRNSALIASGAIAADQLDLLERLMHKKVFAGADFTPPIILDSHFGLLVTNLVRDPWVERQFRQPVPEKPFRWRDLKDDPNDAFHGRIYL